MEYESVLRAIKLENLIEVTEDFVAAALLQIFINLHLYINEDWIPKERKEYIQNYSISERQFDRAVRILLKKDLIAKKIIKLGDKPTLHVKLKVNKIVQLLVLSQKDKIVKLDNAEVIKDDHMDSSQNQEKSNKCCEEVKIIKRLSGANNQEILRDIIQILTIFSGKFKGKKSKKVEKILKKYKEK